MDYTFFNCDQCGNEIRLSTELSGADYCEPPAVAIPQIQIVWPDGSIEWLPFASRLRGLTRTVEGRHQRPVSMTCSIDISSIRPPNLRDQVRMKLRKAGISVPA